MDKIVIFDWGGVVESHENNLQDCKNAAIRLIKRFNNTLTDEEILERWTSSTNSKGTMMAATNDIDEIVDWVNFIKQRMNINVSFDDFKKSYEEEYSKVKYYKDVVAYAHSLKNRCKIAILSNLMPFDKKRINDQYDLSKFDYVYLSFEVGMRKPDKKIYEYVVNDLKIDPKQILFIDDDSNNILAAQACGWNTCQAFGYELEKIKNAVEEFLD